MFYGLSRLHEDTRGHDCNGCEKRNIKAMWYIS